jgi:hypothetical protein
MAEEYTLQYTGEQINERLGKAGNAVLFTSQPLSEAQQAQAKENLGVTDPNFYVTATVVSGAEDDYECTADKTMAEITAAYNSNKSVYLRFSPVNDNYLRIPLVTCQSGAIGFSLYAGGESAGSLGGGVWEALIEDDDSFFVTRKEVSGSSGVYVLSDGETLDNVPESAVLVIDHDATLLDAEGVGF